MRIRIATRKSALALWQANHVAALLRSMPQVDDTELVALSTRGDEILDRSLQKIGGKGLFIKELEIAMQDGVADVAVHSMKDVPVEMPAGFCVAATLKRANAADALVSHTGQTLHELPAGARVGSSSLRRQAQLLAVRPDLKVTALRGNVNTRLQKLENGDYDAIVLAAAGLERLQLQVHISEEFAPEVMMPAVAQGVLGVECLDRRDDLQTVLRSLNDADAADTTRAERAVAKSLGASCQSPVAAYATLEADNLHLSALVARADGAEILRDSIAGKADDAEALGQTLAQRLLDNGAAVLLQSATGESGGDDG